MYFLLTRHKNTEYNIHVIGKLLNLRVHRTCLLKVLVICLRAGFVRSKWCSLLERVSKKALWGFAKLWKPCYKRASEVGKVKWMQRSAVFMKSSAKIHLVCQIGLGKPLWARVFKACCCNSDYCERYCDWHKLWTPLDQRICYGCNSYNCVRYCDDRCIPNFGILQ